MKNIFLIGFMGAGKSTIAAELCQMEGLRQIEMDALIVEQQGMAIADIFAIYGEEHFRDLESQLVNNLGEETGLVISCGGGVVVRPQNVEAMKKQGQIICLRAQPETIYERVKDSTERPILNGHMNVEYIRQLMEKRRELYVNAADVIIDTDNLSVREVCEKIKECVK